MFSLQLGELEKILSEGQVFTEFQKLERRSEVSKRNFLHFRVTKLAYHFNLFFSLPFQNLATTSAQLEINAERNRFKDVVPYDVSKLLKVTLIIPQFAYLS